MKAEIQLTLTLEELRDLLENHTRNSSLTQGWNGIDDIMEDISKALKDYYLPDKVR